MSRALDESAYLKDADRSRKDVGLGLRAFRVFAVVHDGHDFFHSSGVDYIHRFQKNCSGHAPVRLIREHRMVVLPEMPFGIDGYYLRIACGALQKATLAEGMGRLTGGLRECLG